MGQKHVLARYQPRKKVRRKGSVTVSGWAFPLPFPTDSSQLLPSFRVSLRERASQSDGAS